MGILPESNWIISEKGGKISLFPEYRYIKPKKL
jgi:hypothetical protein